MVKIFADGADKNSILELNKNPLIQGWTTNPTLMRKAGVTNYKHFALDLIYSEKFKIKKPISFEVISDNMGVMHNQAVSLSLLGDNVYVKIPITNTKGVSTYNLIDLLSKQGVKLNITAITTIQQVEFILPALNDSIGAYISIFAGRIADTGVNPVPIMKQALKLIKGTNIELIWASPREVYNIYQAEEIGCQIITCSPEMIKKYESLKGKDLTEYSLDTVKMFFNDAKEAGYEI